MEVYTQQEIWRYKIRNCIHQGSKSPQLITQVIQKRRGYARCGGVEIVEETTSNNHRGYENTATRNPNRKRLG